MRTCPTCIIEKEDNKFNYGYRDCKLCVNRRQAPRQLERARARTAANTKAIPRVYNDEGTITHKRCSYCRNTLAIDTFNTHPNQKDGYNNVCRPCASFRWKEKIDQRRLPYLLNRVRSSARDKGLPFNLKLEDIVIPSHCPVLGIELEFGKSSTEKSWRDNSPSLDRIVPELGYVKENVIVVSYRANRIKNDATIEELQKVANFYYQLTDGVYTV